MTQYQKLLKHPKWFEKRKIILMRDGNECKICGSGKNLQVHHRQYHIKKRSGKFALPWEYNVKYLMTICSSCHQKGHSIYDIPKFKI